MDDQALSPWGGSQPDDVAALSCSIETRSSPGTLSASLGEKAPDGESFAERALAIELDRTAGGSFDLAEAWRRLGACEWRVRDTFETGRRLYVTIEEETGKRRRPAGEGGLAMIEQVLLGDSAKAVAIDRQVSQSTVALAVKSRLRMMGVSCRLRALPLILVMAARAACNPRRGIVVGRMAVMPAPFRGRVISVEQPDFRLAEELSDSERSVLLQIMDGKSYVQVACVRRTSTRTVANQLGSVFRKLGVSGYGQTLDLLMSRTLGGGACMHP